MEREGRCQSDLDGRGEGILSAPIAVIGTGTWGTTLSILLANKGLAVTLCCRTMEEAERLQSGRENAKHLPGRPFPPNLRLSADLGAALCSVEAALLAVPAQTMRENARAIAGSVDDDTLVLSCAKGIELGSGLRMTEVLVEELPRAARRVAALSGPNLAKEIAAGLPATSVVAAREPGVRGRLRELLMTSHFRVYTNADLAGVEFGGALKNIIAIGAGFCDGLRVGDNAKAAFIARGLAEMARFGASAGASSLTFAGLAGLGDVLATCMSPQSRNRRVGEQMALGRALDEVQAGLGGVAEGVSTTAAVRALARQRGIEMPITELTNAVLFEGKDPRQAIAELMTRHPKEEFAGIES